MKRRLPGLKIILGILLCGIAWSHAQTVDEIFSKQLPLKSGGLVTLKNTNGRVQIEGWDKEEFYLEAEKQVKADSRKKAEEIMGELEIVIDESRDEISVETREPQKSGGFWDWIFGENFSASINYDLRVPHNSQLMIDNTNGSIEITGVDGDLQLETTNGKIVAGDIGGSIQGNTTNGSIDCDIARIASDGQIQFTTTNGDLTISLPGKSAFDLRARTTNGSINTDFPVNISGKLIGNRVESDVNGGGPLVYLITTNGSIRVRER